MAKDEIRFSYNWNGKLNNSCFTTLRLYNPEKYFEGAVHSVLLKTRDRLVSYPRKATIIEVRKIFGGDLNEFVCRLDTGYSVEETKLILCRMYKRKTIDDVAFSLALYSYNK